MTRLLLFFFAALLSLLAHATVEIEDIWYNLDSSTMQAEVAYQGTNYNKFNEKYSGNITIPSTVTHNGVTYSVTSIEDQAFIYCYSLNTITIPASVKTIGAGAFQNCSLRTINIPEDSQLKSIGDQAFIFCYNLKTLTIPASMTTIGAGAFQNCSLEAINIPEDSQLESIGDNAFNCSYNLKSITIPEKVTSIGNSAFQNSALTTITCNAATLPTIGKDAFAGLNIDSMYVPAGNITDYQGAAGWPPASNIKARQYTLSISDAGYATLYLNYAVTIPGDVEVYYASSVEGNQLRMTRVEGVLPASTGVVVVKREGSYPFTEAEEKPAAIEGNLFKGTADKRSITAEKRCKYYVLAKRNNVVGMYKAKITDGKFVNNANKSYLPLYVDGLDIYDEETDTEADGGQLSNGLRFDFGGSTGIQNSEFTIQHSELIYDLQGRKVTDIEGLKGIYIVGGKKRVLK